MKRNKEVPFNESILAQMGWTEDEYNDFMYWYCQFLMGHNLKMPVEYIKHYSEYKPLEETKDNLSH